MFNALFNKLENMERHTAWRLLLVGLAIFWTLVVLGVIAVVRLVTG